MTREILGFLADVELGAARLYDAAARRLRAYGESSALLVQLADDERRHARIIERLQDEAKDVVLPFRFDEEDRRRLLVPLDEARTCLEQGSLSTTALCRFVAILELGEWNELFTYVIRTIRRKSRALDDDLATLQAHVERVQTFLAGRREGQAALEAVREGFADLTTHVLVVDDDPGVLSFLAAVFRGGHRILPAGGSRQALDLLNDASTPTIDLVISDYLMEPEDGVDFCEAACAAHPNLAGRFLFFTGSSDDRLCNFCEAKGLSVLEKPAPITQLRTMVESLIDRLDTPR